MRKRERKEKIVYLKVLTVPAPMKVNYELLLYSGALAVDAAKVAGYHLKVQRLDQNSDSALRWKNSSRICCQIALLDTIMISFNHTASAMRQPT